MKRGRKDQPPRPYDELFFTFPPSLPLIHTSPHFIFRLRIEIFVVSEYFPEY